MLGIIINAYTGSSDHISFIKAAIGDINSNRHRSVQELLDVLQMLQMFRPLNADDCRVAPWCAKTYFASELRKLLNAVANWSRSGIHSSLRVWGRSESQQRRVNRTHVRERLSPDLWLAVGWNNTLVKPKNLRTQKKKASRWLQSKTSRWVSKLWKKLDDLISKCLEFNEVINLRVEAALIFNHVLGTIFLPLSSFFAV